MRKDNVTMMINNVPLNYTVMGEGTDVILLHGWAQNIEMMLPIGEYLQQWFRVWILDLPGFAGKTPEPSSAWDVYDYTNCLRTFIAQQKIDKPTLIGHSFGGRMSIIYAATETNIDKVVLFDSAGIKPKRTASYYTKIYTYKATKSVLNLLGTRKLKEKFTQKVGSSDYQNATPIMKETLSKVVNEDLTYLLSDIKASTLLIWGENDEATPVSDAKIMEQLIPNAGLVVLPNAGHYAYLECLSQVQLILNSFLVQK